MPLTHGSRATKTKNLIFHKVLPVVALLFACVSLGTQNVIAQGSDLEKKVYKDTAPKTKKKSTPKKKPTPKPSATKRSSARAKTPRRSSGRKRASSETVKFKFSTPDPNQQIWLGEEMLGVSNEDSVLEKPIRLGNYLVSVRDAKGKVVLKSQLVNVTKENRAVVLKADPPPEPKNETPPAEESLDTKIEDSIAASKRILDILARYGDPDQYRTVTLADWEYIYRRVSEDQVHDFTEVQVQAQKWFASGQIELYKTNYPAAITAFNESREFLKGSVYPDYALGETYLADGKPDVALTFYQKAVAIDPKFALAHGRIADILAKQGEHKDSAKKYRTAVELGYDDARLKIDLATQLMEKKKWEEATSVLEQVLKDAPSGDVYLKLGHLYYQLKRPISAFESYLRATELMPDSSEAFFALGRVYHEEREFERSRKAFKRAMALDKTGEHFDLGLARKFLREAEKNLRD